MLFNSVVFLVFFAIVYALYVTMRHRGQNTLLLIASFVFYGWWDVRFLMLIVLSSMIDFAGGLGIDGQRLRRGELVKMSLLTLCSVAMFLVPDWPSVTLEVIRSDPMSLIGPSWKGGWAAIWGCAAFAVVGPILYPLYFRIRSERTRRKVFLATSMVANLSILGFFKYFNFFVSSMEGALAGLGMTDSAIGSLRLDIVLPVGISFYTFQTMSYSIDIYRREAKPTRSFLDFALFVSFFPQLVAGPIERAKMLLPQVLEPRRIDATRFRDGVFLVVWGLFKKVMIADRAAVLVNATFREGADPTGMEMLIAIYAFAWQIYCDFSGYSDIARGLSKMMGFELMLNFRLPYFATNPSDFWRRWHISLSTWLRDYLYIPLGGNRGGTVMMYRNLVLTMLLGGLWHGAAWTFVVWGAYQGAVLVAHRLITGGRPRPDPALPSRMDGWKRLAVIVAYFQVTCFGWLIFRATSLDQVRDFSVGIATDFRPTVPGLIMLAQLALLAVPLLMVQVAQHRANDLLVPLRWSRARQVLVASGLGCAALAYWILFDPGGEGGPQQFIYFQF